MSDYRVGQVLFIIPADTANVVPVLIMERRISETVEGTAVKHVVKSPKPKAQPMILETIKGLVFSDLKVAREMMVRNATQAIDSMIKHASSVAHQAFSQKPAPVVQQQDVDPFDTSDVLIDESSQDDERSLVLQAPRIKSQVDYAATDVDDDGTTEVMLPDGRKQRVRLKVN